MSKRKRFLLQAAVFSLLVMISLSAWAAGPAGAGGGGGHQDSPDYGDLFVLLRDVRGVPVLDADSCQQPIASAAFAGCEQIVQREGVPAEELIPEELIDQCLVPTDPETCAVLLDYANYTQEVEFSRTSVVRSPDSVFDQQLEDALLSLSTAGCISLDPAGRLVYSSVVDGAVVTNTIDSPLQNLAIYRQLMQNGNLGANVEMQGKMLDMAARALGASVDKTGKVSVDMVVYLNEIMGLTGTTLPSPLTRACIPVKEEVKGVVQMVEKCFVVYNEGTGLPYLYDRGSTFGNLPNPPYIADLSGNMDGIFEYLKYVSDTTYTIARGPILAAVPELSVDPGLQASWIGGFAQAADDTRAVINFMHIWPVPEDQVTPVPCSVGGDTFYDVSISDVSGLQVPERMVAGTEGREGSVTITNAGPAEASGTVTVTGQYEINGVVYSVDLSPITTTSGETAAYEKIGEDVFSASLKVLAAEVGAAAEETTLGYEFTLPAGLSATWAFAFSMGSETAGTTITWRATVNAENDVNLANNTVVEQTQVTTATGGSGGSGGAGGGGGRGGGPRR